MGESGPTASVITPPGEGGIGIVALAGPGAVEVLEKVFHGTRRRARTLKPGRIAHGTVRDGARLVDEVIVARPDPPPEGAPLPYFEINCHGGVTAVRAVLGLLCKHGAQPVDWRQLTRGDQFSKPLSGTGLRRRALHLLPRAPTRLGAIMLLHQAAGALSAARERLKAHLKRGQVKAARSLLEELLEAAAVAKALLEPQSVVLLGPPNVGKSTLLNALLRRERVLVHSEPGTTRDLVRERVSVRGMPFELIDSAGVRAARDEVEEAAVQRTIQAAAECDIALIMFDARSRPADALRAVPPVRQGARVVLVGNKVDLLREPPVPPGDLPHPVLYISAREGLNLTGIEDALLGPAAAHLERIKSGAPAPFDEPARRAVRRVLETLAEGPQAALEALSSATG